MGASDSRVSQSQIIMRSGQAGSVIIPHQDGSANFTNPPSSLTDSYALDDSVVENGCLEVDAGSHLKEPIRTRLVKSEKGEPKFENLETPLWAPRSTEEQRKKVERSCDNTVYHYTPFEVKKGSLIVLQCKLLHQSSKNRRVKGRMAYAFVALNGNLNRPENIYFTPDN